MSKAISQVASINSSIITALQCGCITQIFLKLLHSSDFEEEEEGEDDKRKRIKKNE